MLWTLASGDDSTHGFAIWIMGHVPSQLCYAYSESLLLTPLCCNDIHDVTPRVSALAGCDNLALYDNESWNNPRDFAKLVKAISFPQDDLSTSDRRLIELENQVQCLMEAHIAPKQPVQVNKVTSSCKICSGPYDTQNCMENLKQAFVDYASLRTDEAGGKWFEADFKQQQGGKTNKIDTVLMAITDRMTGALPSDTVKNPKLNVNSTSSVLSARENKFTKTGTTDEDHHIMVRVESEYNKLEEDREEEGNTKNINLDPPSPPDPSISFITEKIMRERLEPREDTEGISRISNFTGRIKGMDIFVGNFTYVADFMIVKDISSIIDPRLSQVVLGKPFVEIFNMTHDLSLVVVKFIDRINEIFYKMPHKIEQYNSLSDLEKEYTKSVYLKNEEDKRRGVEYVMSKILWFYKECLELGPEYLTGVADEGEVT
ncbi:hypothetical protein Tco_1418441 [Tanacetum coccineum]